MVDGRGFQGGLCDRWKGIVSLYAFAKAVHRDFRIYYTYPFDLRLFQLPNRYDWTLSESELSRNVRNVKLLRVVGEPGFSRMQNLPAGRQIHCYANRDWIEPINSTFGTDFRWGELFTELFRPSSLLKNKLQSFSRLMSQPYVAVALRVQNLFGDFAEYDYRPASDEVQERLVTVLTEYVRTIHDRHQCPILINAAGSFIPTPAWLHTPIQQPMRLLRSI